MLSSMLAPSFPIYSALVYHSRRSCRGLDSKIDQVQDLIEDLKLGDVEATRICARALAGHPSLQGWRGTVVPAPRSAAGRPSLLGLARALVAEGVGSHAAELVVRETPVESSRLRRKSGLEGVSIEDHVQSLRACSFQEDDAVLIVDDVVTTGATIRAAGWALRLAGYQGPLYGAAAAHYEPKVALSYRPIAYIELGMKYG